MRYDAVLSDQGLKLLEINCSSALSGWELNYFQCDVRARLARYAGTRDWNIAYRYSFQGTPVPSFPTAIIRGASIRTTAPRNGWSSKTLPEGAIVSVVFEDLD